MLNMPYRQYIALASDERPLRSEVTLYDITPIEGGVLVHIVNIDGDEITPLFTITSRGITLCELSGNWRNIIPRMTVKSAQTGELYITNAIGEPSDFSKHLDKMKGIKL